MNRPSFQFYPQDWGDDPGLQMCSLEARGLWIEMMRLMHKGQPYGHLQLNGAEPVDPRRLSLYVRADEATVTRALQELENNHVFSKNEDGIIYSRRMVRDEEQRQLTRKRVKKHRVKKKKSNGDVTLKKRRSSSSSSSSSSVTKIPTGSSTGESADADSWPSWYAGITWNKKARKVEFSEDAKRELAAHLTEIAEEENLRPLNRQELQRGWGRLNGNLLRNRQCRGPKSLPPIVVNWFENDLRDPNRIRGPTAKSQRANDAFDEAIRKAEEEERGGKVE